LRGRMDMAAAVMIVMVAMFVMAAMFVSFGGMTL
jgi:hypothetical protein